MRRRKSTALALVILVLSTAVAVAAAAKFNVWESFELQPVPGTDLPSGQLKVEYLPGGGKRVTGTFIGPSSPDGMRIDFTTDGGSGTYSAQVTLEPDATPESLVPEPGDEGCPWRLCSRQLWVSGRNTQAPGQPVENVTRTNIEYLYSLESLEADLVSWVQRCTPYSGWYLLDFCVTPPPIDDYSYAWVGTLADYAPGPSTGYTQMHHETGITVANGIEAISFTITITGDQAWRYEPTVYLSPHSCRLYVV